MPTITPYREGSITGYRVDVRHEGARVRRKFATKAAALAFVKMIQSGGRVDDGSVADTIGEYLRRAEKLGQKTANTLRSDRQRLGVFARWCGENNLDLAGLDTQAMRRFQDYYFAHAPFTAHHHRRESDPKRTWEKYRQTIAALLNWCLGRHLVPGNPLAGPEGKEFRVRIQQHRPDRILSRDEVVMLLDYMDRQGSIIAGFFRLAAYAGMRVAEIIGLEWSEVDLEGGRLTVSKTLYGDTKSKNTRTIWICSQLRPTLEKLPKGTRYVLDNGHGLPAYTESWYWKLLRRATEELGLRPCRIHDLRHTWVSHLLMAGVDPYTVMRMAGHSSITTTINTYGHLIADHAREAVEKLPF